MDKVTRSVSLTFLMLSCCSGLSACTTPIAGAIKSPPYSVCVSTSFEVICGVVVSDPFIGTPE